MRAQEWAAPQFQAGLTDLSESVRGVDVRSFEEADARACSERLIPRVDELVSSAIDIAQRILDHYDQLTANSDSEGGNSQPARSLRPVPADSVGFEATSQSIRPGTAATEYRFFLDQLVGDHQRGPALVADIAFMMLMDLREKRQRLMHIAGSLDHWEQVAVASSARRRVLKSCTALELVLCEVEGLKSHLDYRTELSLALEVRRHYAALRASIDPATPPGAEELLPRLRQIGTRIAMLVGNDVYPDLRVHDRVELRALQGRIIDWLREPPEPRTGMRLWQDLVGFANLIAQVSRRQELLDHDGALTAHVQHELASLAPSAEVPTETYERLGALRGRHDDVDSLLSAGVRDVRSWRQVLALLGPRSPRAHSQIQSVGDMWDAPEAAFEAGR